jgi:DivIVA domain-containing protein
VRSVEILLVVLVVIAAVAVALGWGDRLATVSVDRAPAGLPPAGRLSAYDVAQVRFNLALRGYRMSEVDDVLSQLAAELAERDDRLAALEAHISSGGDVAPPDPAAPLDPSPAHPTAEAAESSPEAFPDASRDVSRASEKLR